MKGEWNMRRIIKNQIRCNFCGDVIESKTVHDWVACKCGRCFVDGGLDYLRRGYPNSKKDWYTELSQWEDVDADE